MAYGKLPDPARTLLPKTDISLPSRHLYSPVCGLHDMWRLSNFRTKRTTESIRNFFNPCNPCNPLHPWSSSSRVISMVRLARLRLRRKTARRKTQAKSRCRSAALSSLVLRLGSCCLGSCRATGRGNLRIAQAHEEPMASGLTSIHWLNMGDAGSSRRSTKRPPTLRSAAPWIPRLKPVRAGHLWLGHIETAEELAAHRVGQRDADLHRIRIGRVLVDQHRGDVVPIG